MDKPSKWEMKYLHECFTLASGSTKPTDIEASKPNDTYFPVYGGNGIMGYSKDVFSEETQLVIGRVGEKCGCVHLARGPHWITDNALYTKNFKIQASVEYFAYLLEYLQLSKVRNKGGQPLISQQPIYKIQINLPQKEEQLRIVNVLDKWGLAIDHTQKLIEAKMKLKKALMQHLLTGKKRLLRFENIPWSNTQVGNYFVEFSERNIENKDLEILSCTKNQGIMTQSDRFGKRMASKSLERYKIVKNGDLIYDPMLLWDASIGFLKVCNMGVISPAYSTFKFNEQKGDRNFFELLFDTHYMRGQYKIISQGTNVRRRKAPKDAFLKIKIEIPTTLQEQREIANVFNTLDREIMQLSLLLSLYRKQKKGLMRVLLTGVIKVSA